MYFIMKEIDKITSFTKAFAYEGGALVIVALIPTFTLNSILEELFFGVELKRIILPLLVFGILTLLYIFIALIDYSTGIRAAKYLHWKETNSTTGYIDNDKRWNAIWKLCGVLIISSIFTVFSMLFAVMGFDKLNTVFLAALSLFYFVVVLFEAHSIGDNQKKRFGKKSAYYLFLDEVSQAVRIGIIKNLGKLISRLFGNDNNNDYTNDTGKGI